MHCWSSCRYNLIPFLLVVVLSSALPAQRVWLQRHCPVSLARPALRQRHHPSHIWQVRLLSRAADGTRQTPAAAVICGEELFWTSLLFCLLLLQQTRAARSPRLQGGEGKDPHLLPSPYWHQRLPPHSEFFCYRREAGSTKRLIQFGFNSFQSLNNIDTLRNPRTICTIHIGVFATFANSNTFTWLVAIALFRLLFPFCYLQSELSCDCFICVVFDSPRDPRLRPWPFWPITMTAEHCTPSQVSLPIERILTTDAQKLKCDCCCYCYYCYLIIVLCFIPVWLLFSLLLPGLDYVSHEDILPYNSTEQVPIQHELFERFLMYNPTKCMNSSSIETSVSISAIQHVRPIFYKTFLVESSFLIFE